MRLLPTAMLVLCPSIGQANEPPPIPEGGINYYLEGACLDNETGQKGYCYMGTTHDGRTLMTFWQNDVLMLIREVVGDGYKSVWLNPMFASF